MVSPTGSLTTIEEAIAIARSGDTIEVHGGVYAAPLLIDKSVILVGVDHPVIDGGNEGSLVVITAPDVVLKGFTLRNSGSTIHHEDTGIIVQSPHVTLEDNVLENVLFGIYFANAPDGIARRNTIQGLNRDESSRGDGIRLWYSDNIQIIENVITTSRDMLVSYSNNLKIEGNTFHHNRYGLHFMYSNNVSIRHNTIENNSVGAFLMYSQHIVLEDNRFSHNRGSSGYGLALKDMDGVTVNGNVFVGNQVGLYLDNSPSLYEGYNTYQGNIFAYNDVGVVTLPSVERNVFQKNNFLHNLEHVGIWGREIENRNIWFQDGVGNYWNDYVGYDQDGDNIGDTPYRADRLFENLTDRYPVLKLFEYSPATQAIEFTASAFPVLRPIPKVEDNAPLMTPSIPASLKQSETSVSLPFLALSFLLILLALGIIGTAGIDWQFTKASLRGNSMIVVNNLVKKYGQFNALAGMSFTVQPGESVALWGINGAGKTSTLRCLMGILSFEGSITINGIDVARNGKTARAAIGYIPQEAAFPDLSVKEALHFYARLKKVSSKELPVVLEKVGLTEQTHKPVWALSGGMKQRLALAIALLGNPPILLLDEATANLDTQARHDFLNLVVSLNRAGKTIVFSTHRVDEVMALAQRVLVLKDGQVSVECSPGELVDKLGLQRWLRIWVEPDHQSEAVRLLQQHGFTPVMNTRAFYVNVGTTGKMAPLRILQAAQITVNDFDVVESKDDGLH